MNQEDDIGCEYEKCNRPAILSGSNLLIIDGKRYCWPHGVIIKKAKDRCVRVPYSDLQTVGDILDMCLNSKEQGRIMALTADPEVAGVFKKLTYANHLIKDLLNEKESPTSG